MKILAEWSVSEYLGYSWPAQLVWRELDEPVDGGALAVIDDRGDQVPAQLGEAGTRVYYIADLPAGERRQYRLVRVREELSSPLLLRIDGGVAELTNGRMGLRLSWEGNDLGVPPLLGIRGIDGIWFGGSAWRGGAGSGETHGAGDGRGMDSGEAHGAGDDRGVEPGGPRGAGDGRDSDSGESRCEADGQGAESGKECCETDGRGADSGETRGAGSDRKADSGDLRCEGNGWGANFCELHGEVVELGPVFVRLRQTYRTVEGGSVCWEYLVDSASPVVRVTLRQEGKVDGGLIWNLGEGFRPDRGYWRPHSPAPWRGERGKHHRQVYGLRYLEEFDEIRLGPFYNWEKDAASFWAGWQEEGRKDLLYLGCVRPGMTRTAGAYQRLRLTTGCREGEPFFDVEVPPQQGTRAFALGLLDRDAVRIAIQGEAGDLDRFHARLNGPGLDDYHQMALDWPGLEELAFPRLWLAPEELPSVRERFAEWGWLRERFQEHVDDALFDTHQSPQMRLGAGQRVLGQDLAGAYLATGDEEYARRAKGPLVRELEELVRLFLDYGPAVDQGVAISLSRLWRALALNLDLILSSAAFSRDERGRVLRWLAFVAEVGCSGDAWPPTGNGIHRGNPNFHPDMVSARGIAAALLAGHPRQGEWIEAAVAEMREFLRAYHLDSGCSQESATYQLVTLAYALQLQVALGRLGYSGIVEEPAFRRSFEFLAATQTPVDPRCGFRMLPTIGHVTAYGWCQSLQAYFAWAARAAAATHPEFSARMMAAWKRGGGFVFSLHDFHSGLVWSPPLCLFDGDLPVGEDPGFPESRVHAGFGAVMRAAHADGCEGYLAFKMGECTGHFDCDEGSLIWYAFGKPLLTDFGCQYNPNFHAHPWLHNRISVDHAADGHPRGGRLLAHYFSPGIDLVCGEVCIRRLYRETEWPVRDREFDFRQVMEPVREIDEHVWRRHVLYVHFLEVVILLDQIDGSLPTDWNLQVLADCVRTAGNEAILRGQFGIDLKVKALRPADPGWEVAAYAHLGFDEPRLPMWWWRGAVWTAPPGISLGPMGEQALTLRGHAGPGQSYLVALAAFPQEEEIPEIDSWEGEWSVAVRTGRGCVRARTGPPFDRWEIELETDTGSDRSIVEWPVS